MTFLQSYRTKNDRRHRASLRNLACKREASLAVTAELASVAADSQAGRAGKQKAMLDHYDHD